MVRLVVSAPLDLHRFHLEEPPHVRGRMGLGIKPRFFHLQRFPPDVQDQVDGMCHVSPLLLGRVLVGVVGHGNRLVFGQVPLVVHVSHEAEICSTGDPLALTCAPHYVEHTASVASVVARFAYWFGRRLA
jgi:hypothetical protein